MRTLNAETVANMFLAGAKNLQNNKEKINELNVFPVPDGDTGTNMTMTIMSAVEEIQNIKDFNMQTLSKAISGGSLKGARGNSGVILSQLLRGFSKGIIEHNELDTVIIANAMKKGAETAYKAVMRPKEGTVLTVAKMLSKAAIRHAQNQNDVVDFLDIVLKEGQKALEYTPEQLPVLKEAGVVDSGGQGLMDFLYGAYSYLTGENIDISDIKKMPGHKEVRSKKAEISTADIKFGYCTEFIVMLKKELSNNEKENFRDYLLSIGDSLVFVADEEMVKVHVHTNHPGQAFEKGIEYGELTRMKIDNMREEHREIIAEEGYSEDENFASASNENEELKEHGFVAIAVGEGIAELFRELGVDSIVQGGQTMNPSTSDICDAIEKVKAKNVYVLPNNKNIILAANQAAKIIQNKSVHIILTKTIPEGISAMINFASSDDPLENTASMMQGKDSVKSGEVTYAVRQTSIDGFEIEVDDIMGIYDGKIRAVGKDINTTTMNLIETMVDDDSAIISVYYGADATTDMIDDLQAQLEDRFEDHDIEIIAGSQPVYYYLISVE